MNEKDLEKGCVFQPLVEKFQNQHAAAACADEENVNETKAEGDTISVAKDVTLTLTCKSCCRRRRTRRENAVLLLLLALNICVILLGIVALLKRGPKSEDCDLPARMEPAAVATLSVPCRMREINAEMPEGKQEKDEDGGWMRYTGDVGDELCSPLDHRHHASAVASIYQSVLEEEMEYMNRHPPEYMPLGSYDNPTTPKETLLFTNRYKPSGHVTGTSQLKKETRGDKDGGKGSVVHMVKDWPLRVGYYRSDSSGFVQRMTWGLAVPVSGVYRVHSNVNFFFTHQMQRQGKRVKKTEVPIIHQISRYHARDGTFSVITGRNHSSSTERTDGLTSFLVHLTHLDAGDVISISVSRVPDIVEHDNWHTEGLALVS